MQHFLRLQYSVTGGCGRAGPAHIAVHIAKGVAHLIDLHQVTALGVTQQID